MKITKPYFQMNIIAQRKIIVKLYGEIILQLKQVLKKFRHVLNVNENNHTGPSNSYPILR